MLFLTCNKNRINDEWISFLLIPSIRPQTTLILLIMLCINRRRIFIIVLFITSLIICNYPISIIQFLQKNIGNFFILSFSTLIFIFFIHQPITQQQKQKNNLFPFHSYSHDYSALFSRSLSIHFRLLFPRLSPTSDGPFYPLLTTLFFLSLVESFPLLSFLIFVDISYQSKLTYSLSSLSYVYFLPQARPSSPIENYNGCCSCCWQWWS